MKESAKSKLTVFSRLWVVSMVLFIVLCIVAVIGGMNENKSMMGMATVGIVLMFIMMLCQLIAAVTVRRWWCVAGALFGVLASLFVLVCSVVALAAGQYRPFPAADELAAVTDSVHYSFSDDRVSCSILVLMPVDEVEPSVREWLNEELGGQCQDDSGSWQAMVDYYGEAHTDSLRAILKEGVPDFAELSYEATMYKLFESDKVVTYGLTITLDLGGAHPTTRASGATFSKLDGRRLQWDAVSDDGKKALAGMMREMLMDYFDVETDRELLDNLLDCENVAQIPLPVTPPYMMENGYILIYQQYEIAPYAMGMPCGIIPYETLRPCLTDWAQKLIEAPPTITACMKAIAHQEDAGELLARIDREWDKYQKGQSYEGRFIVNIGAGYLRYMDRQKSGQYVWTDTTEFCCWSYRNKPDRLVVMTHRDYTNGQLADGQYSGLSLYVYDAATQHVEMKSGYAMGIEPPEINGIYVYTMSPEDKSVTVSVNNPQEGSASRTYVWDDSKSAFVLQ